MKWRYTLIIFLPILFFLCLDDERKLKGSWIKTVGLKRIEMFKRENLFGPPSSATDTIFFMLNDSAIVQNRSVYDTRFRFLYKKTSRDTADAIMLRKRDMTVEEINALSLIDVDSLSYYTVTRETEVGINFIKHKEFSSYDVYSPWSDEMVEYQRIYTSLWGVE